MSHTESAIAGFYDHEQEAPSGDRRRPAADWGGDDLFTTAPRRRRFDRPARGDHPVRTETLEHPAPARRAGHDRPAPRLEIELGDAIAAAVADPVPAVAQPAPVVEAAPSAELVLPVEAELPAEPAVRAQAPAPAGRRTVTVTGHPDRRPSRRRPAPTLDERLIGARPERIAAYAFALGLLLLVIAFISAH
jgi:hypothetical protein